MKQQQATTMPTSVWAFLKVTVRLLEMKTCMTCRLQTVNVYTLTPVHRLTYGIIIIITVFEGLDTLPFS